MLSVPDLKKREYIFEPVKLSFSVTENKLEYLKWPLHPEIWFYFPEEQQKYDDEEQVSLFNGVFIRVHQTKIN